MLRGLLLGGVSGLAFSVAVLGTSSLIAPQPAGNRPPERPSTELADSGLPVAGRTEDADGQDAGSGTGVATRPDPGPEVGASEPSGAAMPGDAPAVAAPGRILSTGVERPSAPPIADFEPAAIPEVASPDQALTEPEAVTQRPGIEIARDRPVSPAGASPAPSLPAAEPVVPVVTTPAARPATLEPALETPAETGEEAAVTGGGIETSDPNSPAGMTAAAAELPGGQPAQPESGPELAGASSPAPGVPVSPDQPALSGAPEAGDGPVMTEQAVTESSPAGSALPVLPPPDLDGGIAVPPDGPSDGPEPGLNADGSAPEALGVDGPRPETPDAETPDAETPDAEAPVPEIPTAEAPSAISMPEAPAAETLPAEGPGSDGAALPEVAQPAGTAVLPGGESGIRVNRPATGQDQDGAAAAARPEAETGAGQGADGDDGADQPPLVRFAQPFENSAGLPLVSVIVVDDGAMDPGAAIMLSLPFPVTVGIDPARAGAASDMAEYRAAGFEVVAISSLPVGAGLTDLDVNLQASFATLPEAIALVDTGTGGLTGDRSLTEAALTRLAAEGRGFAWMAGGIDQVTRLAGEAGLPVRVIARDLDGNGQDAAAIRRFLDNAAFRARQDGGSVLLARLQPETISALTLWGTTARAGQVAVAPLSAQLLTE